MVKKALKVLSTTALMFALVAPTAIFASGTGDLQKSTADVKSAKQKTALTQKMAAVAEYQKQKQQSGGIGTMALGESKTIAVPSYKQEKNYWCGPATVKQVLHFFNGSSSSQTTYATKLGTTLDGTDFSLVDNVLNDNQTDNTYVYSSYTSSDYTTWKTAMILSIDWGNPAALDLKITSAAMPLYTSTVEGHILNSSGYDVISESNKKLRLTDPFDQGGRGVTIGNVWHPFDGVWQANQAHFRKAIIW
ncbi:C39 family peptidase [Paenibacillus sp. PL91]|uniref:C39 family peptidase n=1 Tax=Paenibacillus sp. PL91 TaxID=2729538 RepID=UPI00145D0AEC|nr:C39 family peptidase [Paenibacillus sp. PL91]MBC9203737.1 C39 family peptidase [Paenibacillus sp. PL91]